MNTQLNTFSKEAIKARMLQNAVKLWGLKSPNSVDPFVRLLIEAFSTEIFKVNHEVQSIGARILEKLAKLLTPSLYTYPRPAHAIAFTRPVQLNEVLPSHSEFFIKKELSSLTKRGSDIDIQIPFTPVDHIQLTNAKVDMLLVGNTCYHVADGLNKTPIARVPDHIVGHRKIILGVDVSSYASEALPSRLSIYCSNQSFTHLDFIYKLLPFIKVSNNQTVIQVKSGLTYVEQARKSGYEEIFHEYAIRTRMEENIKSRYAHQFIELEGLSHAMIGDPGALPEVLNSLKDRENIQALISDKHYLWLELEFPPQYSVDILKDFSFILNAFPVYNKAWKSHESKLDGIGNNIPLSTEIGENFLYVDEIIDGFGRKYEEIPFTQTDQLKKGIYTVRTGGMERFNDRDALDMISYVLELTRDEVSAFGALDRDKVVETLKSMALQMSALDQKAKNEGKHIPQRLNYVIVDPMEDTDHMKASYWVTHCTLANHIQPDTLLVNQKKTSGGNRSIMLLTESEGGEDEQKGSDAVQAYKYALTTRDKIISIADVKSFCRLFLKDDLKDIRIKRGTMISSKPKEGFIRTINIEIVPSSYSFYGENYWNNMAVSLKNQIVAKAIDGIEYLVQVVDEDVQ
ncbi:MAG: hypothetical protein E6Q83_19110 [Thiothrix sp.]|nr:MAG: hypothetical protein E6Q83_19110 [Thiothrix sp.]